MTISAVPPRIRRGIGWGWIIAVVLGLVVAFARDVFNLR
jgi:hypothetical protein